MSLFVAKSSENLTFLLCVGLVDSPQKDRDFGRVSSEALLWFCRCPWASPKDGSERLSSLSKGTCNVIAGFIRDALSARSRVGVLLDK